MASRRINVFFYGLFMDAGLLRAKGAAPDQYSSPVRSRFCASRRPAGNSHESCPRSRVTAS